MRKIISKKHETAKNRGLALLAYGASLYSEGIDFLTLRIPENTEMFQKLAFGSFSAD